MNPTPLTIPEPGIAVIMDTGLLEILKRHMDGWTDRICARADALLQASGFDLHGEPQSAASAYRAPYSDDSLMIV